MDDYVKTRKNVIICQKLVRFQWVNQSWKKEIHSLFQNPSPDAKEKFQEINTAYNYLQKGMYRCVINNKLCKKHCSSTWHPTYAQIHFPLSTWIQMKLSQFVLPSNLKPHVQISGPNIDILFLLFSTTKRENANFQNLTILFILLDIEMKK